MLNETPGPKALRDLVESDFTLLEQREPLATEPERLRRAREDMVELLRLTLLSTATTGEEHVPRHPRRRALAIALEEWLWRQGDDPEAPSVSLAEAARELDVPARRGVRAAMRR